VSVLSHGCAGENTQRAVPRSFHTKLRGADRQEGTCLYECSLRKVARGKEHSGEVYLRASKHFDRLDDASEQEGTCEL